MTKKFTRLWPLGAGALLAMLLTLPIMILGAGRAEAHAVQVTASPEPNSELTNSPDQLAVTFSEEIEPSVSTMQLWDGEAKEVPLTGVSFPSTEEMVATVSQDLTMGVYTVVWRNLSTVDGHTWAGSYTFSVLGPNGEKPVGGTAVSVEDLIDLPSDTPSTLDSVARWVVLLGGAVLLGGSAYVLFVGLPATGVLAPDSSAKVRSLSRSILLVTGAIGAFLVLEGSLIELLLDADRLGGLGKVDEILFDTRSGNYLIARQALLLVGLGSLALIWRAGERALQLPALVLLLVSSVGVLFTQSMVSHAGGSDGAFWATTADFLHMLAASFWIGALVHIGLAMPRWLDELQGAPRTLFAGDSFRRFSVLAAVSVVVIMASGVFSALVQFDSWSDLWSTNYGWSLIAKMGVMVPLLAVAGLNAFILRPRVVDAIDEVNGGERPAGDSTATGAIARLQDMLSNTVRLEAVLGIVILVAVAVLVQLEPPRAAADAEEQASVSSGPTGALPQDEQGYFLKANQAGGLVLSLRVEPAEIGQNNFEVGVGSEFGFVGEIQETRLDFKNLTQDVGPSRLALPLFGSAKFAASGSNLGLPGDWEVTVTVRRLGEDDVSTTFDLPIRAATSEGGEAEGEGSSSSIWDWPFDGNASVAAIILLSGVAVLALGWGAVSLARRGT
ncbi:MAG: CopD family protein [Dehalococcoidia bacterium]